MHFKVLTNTFGDHHYCSQYVTGLNIISKPFTEGEWGNGFYFYSLEQISMWLMHGSKLAFVSIPEDAKVVHFDYGSKADRIYIEKIIELVDWEMWKSEEFCLKVLSNPDYHNNLKYFENRFYDKEFCLKAVKLNGLILNYVKDRTDDICLEAIKQNGRALVYAKGNNNRLSLEAIKQTPDALEYVQNQTDDIILKAVKKDRNALKHVRNITDVLLKKIIWQSENDF